MTGDGDAVAEGRWNAVGLLYYLQLKMEDTEITTRGSHTRGKEDNAVRSEILGFPRTERRSLLHRLPNNTGSYPNVEDIYM